jgi:ectoine hydroxylase
MFAGPLINLSAFRIPLTHGGDKVKLTQQQIADYDRDGFLIIPDVFSAEEVQSLRNEIERLHTIEAKTIFREREGAIRSIFLVHEKYSPVYSSPFRSLTRSPRVLGPAKQLLKNQDTYVMHTKINVKPALEGTGWLWHQDHGYWVHDGYPEDDLLTALVLLGDTAEIQGALYMIPGSHKLGLQDHYFDDSKAAYQLPQRAVKVDRLKEVMKNSPKPVPVVGKAGSLVLFHCLTIHGSGINMSPDNRWQAYITYNRCANKPNDVENPRGEFTRSTNWAPVPIESDEGILGPHVEELAEMK